MVISQDLLEQDNSHWGVSFFCQDTGENGVFLDALLAEVWKMKVGNAKQRNKNFSQFDIKKAPKTNKHINTSKYSRSQ